MRFSALYAAVVLLLVLTAASVSGQTALKQNNKPMRAAISGRVTIKDKAAVGVVIGMRRIETVTALEPYQKATTDHNGVYRFTGIAGGSYELVPSAPAFVMADLKEGRAKMVIVGEDENVESINFSMVRGGVITGRITDADGRPLIQQEVNLYLAKAPEPQQPGQQRQISPAGTTQTDDRGIYRVFGLNPGRYKVASGRSEERYAASLVGLRSTYKQVFYPDAGDQEKATVIEVGEGTEAANIDIMLGREVQTFSASGRVVDAEKGQPLPNIRFFLQRTSGQVPEFVNSLVASNAKGDFIVEGLLPGKYGVFLMQGQGEELRAETVNFEILDQDLTGVTIKLAKGASISGLIVLDQENKSAVEKLSQLHLRAYAVGSGGSWSFGSSASSPIGPDGSFRLAALPGGTVNLTLGSSNMASPPKGFIISRIERDGIVQPRRIELKEGEQMTGLRVTVSYGSATVRGVVILENGSLPEGGRIMVRLSKPGEPGAIPGQAMADARGHFLLEGIPTGSYELWVTIATGLSGPPQTVKRDITVQDGVVTDLTITMDLSAPQKP